jgi:hypothetical protein
MDFSFKPICKKQGMGDVRCRQKAESRFLNILSRKETAIKSLLELWRSTGIILDQRSEEPARNVTCARIKLELASSFQMSSRHSQEVGKGTDPHNV